MIAPEVTVEAGPARRERRLQYGFAQNVPLILAFTILAALSALYIGLFHGQLHRYPRQPSYKETTRQQDAEVWKL